MTIVRLNELIFNSKIILWVILCFNSCIDPFTLVTTQNDPILTVDGLISTAEGPHSVRLTLTDRYGSVNLGQIKTVNNAEVVIRDEYGNIEILDEYILDSITFFNSSQPNPFIDPNALPTGWVTIPVFRRTGIYKTSTGFKAEIGKSYTLQVRLPSGEMFSSLPEKVIPVVPIEDISLLSYRSPTVNPLVDDSGINIVARFTDPSENQNFYMWRLSEPVYTYVTSPEVNGIECCNTCFRFDDYEIAKSFESLSDDAFNGLTTYQPVLSISDDGWRFKDKLRVKVNQYSVSKNGYYFLDLLKKQLGIKGSVFDPPPANIRGNIINLNDPEKQVLGYFFASDVSSKLIYIRNTDLIYKQTPGIFHDDCREAKGFSTRLTTTPPTDWDYN